MGMDIQEHKTQDGIEKGLDLEERPNGSPPRIDRRKALKVVLASAPVILTFTAGVARVDARDYSYLSDVSGGDLSTER